ncbi:helix-turn-helix domain-containing protein [Nesterenkonia sp. CL21]|uniref:helix-turn-helix domain-containing protein n=1 Tax=Nesterenkonia sp. CL21 TaxID=3064894 RepID=UPI0037C8909E
MDSFRPPGTTCLEHPGVVFGTCYARLSIAEPVRAGFLDAFGVTPHTFLSILRARRMAKVVRETDQPISQIYRQVGWLSRCHAAIIFRRYFGVNASEYRRCGLPTASLSGTGVGVARAAKSANESAKQRVSRGTAVELSTGEML